MKDIKKNLLLTVLLIITLISFVVIIFMNITEEKYNYLTQLGNKSSRQMMGYVIKTKNGKLIVIDGGTKEDTDNLKDNIYKNGGTVDFWFLTHAHDDHVGAFIEIANESKIQINNVYASLNDMSWYEENDNTRANSAKELIDTLKKPNIKEVVKKPKINEKINIDNIKIEVLGIKNPEFTENAGNEQSMVIKFDTGKTTLLFLGDTGVKSSEKLLNTQKAKLKSDIVQMAHHGQAGATKELYQEIKPSICLWPTPDWLWDNNSGEGYDSGSWKTLETRKWMEELDVKENYIEKDGNKTIKVK